MSDPLKWVLAIILGTLFLRNYDALEYKLVLWLTSPAAVECAQVDLLRRKRNDNR